ncbi:MAG: SDR family oxidoreductase [Elusimicrobia bacterium]|nr:SDR family oxidoreductase [Elusimicrobiota bacterium]
MCLKYTGRKVLILGGSSEIGLAAAKVLSGRGLEVFSTYYANQARLKAGAAKARPVYLDLGDIRTFSEVKAGSYDYLVDLAHTDRESLVLSAADSGIEEYFRTNVINRTILLKELGRKMLLRRFGRLVYVSSAALNLPSEGQGWYVSSKSAVESVYRQLGLELVKKGITTVCLRYSCLDGGRGKRFLEKPALPPIKPEEAAGQIAYFLSDGSRGINAVSITIDQGLPSYKRKSGGGRE